MIKYSIIKTKEQYKTYLKRFEEIFDCKEGTILFHELELLGLLIDKYETEEFKIPSSDPVETIKFIMEQNNLKPSDLGKILNSPSRATEILKRQRKLSLNHIRVINTEMKIPSDTLIQDYKLEA